MAGHGHPTSVVLFVAFSLLLGVLCRSLAKAINGVIPYTVLLLIFGVLWGVMEVHTSSELGDAADTVENIDPHLFLQVFLPLLIFESAFSMKWHIFKRLLPQMMTLAVLGVVIASTLTACALRVVVAPFLSWSECFMLGAIVSATDPVAVVALLKELGGSAKLRTLVEGESLLNDGTAIVIFSVFLDISGGADLGAADVAKSFFQLALGGVGLGILWGAVTIWLIGMVHKDALVETTLTVASTYLLFHVAEELCHVSGVLAIVALGASFVWYGKTKISPAVAHSLHEFWATLAYFGETIVFVLAGALLAQKVDFSYFSGADYGNLLLLYVFLMVIRAVMVVILAPILVHFGYGFGVRRAAVLVHGGLRGAVSLAMALLVELEQDIPEKTRNYVLFYGAGVTFLTLVINAPTAGSLVRWLGLLRASHAESEQFTRGVKLLSSKMSDDMRHLVEHAPEDQKALCNWPKVKQFLSFEELIRPMTQNFGRKLSSAELAVISQEPTEETEDEAHGLIMPAEDTDTMCCASVRQPEHRMSPQQLRLQEARLRFLRGTVEVYHDLALEGQLTSDALNALLAAEEAAEDRCHKPLSEWMDTLWSVCKNPSWLSYLLKKNRVSFLDPVLRWGIKSTLARGVRVASAYVEAHRRMLGSLKGRKEVVDQLRQESTAATRAAKAYLEKAARKYPAETAQIYTEQVTNHMLSQVNKEIHTLAGQGHFVDAELDTLSTFIKKKQAALLRGRATFAPPSERDILRISRLFTLVDEGIFNEIMLEHDDVSIDTGAILLSPQHSQDAVFYVAQGTLEYTHPDGFQQMLDRGTYLNVAAVLAGKEPLLTITARENCRLLRFPGEHLRHIAASSHPDTAPAHLAANMARLAAFELLYLFGAEMLANASSLHLRVLSQAQVRTAHVVRDVVREADVFVLRKGDAFEVRDLGIVVMGRVASTRGAITVESVSHWQYCRAGEYACVGASALVVVFDCTALTQAQGRADFYPSATAVAASGLNLNTAPDDAASATAREMGEMATRTASTRQHLPLHVSEDNDDDDDDDDNRNDNDGAVADGVAETSKGRTKAGPAAKTAGFSALDTSSPA